ncbi:hypothetical protein C8J57DRAFT_137467 [Mycena rebaudengoi]|nr:hypothetical protein C8J57DRAFT_1404977 [Mycena rebaudengoi]KAJ7236112.1 hypothetical protein C8J57DRAFT_137467 [Mycena rebaudengoi]
MFTKFCTLALAVSSALAITITTPTSVTSGNTTTIEWIGDSSDPIFSIELMHPSFNDALAIANNINSSDNSISLVIPSVPTGDGYTLQFVNVTDISKIYATSSSFSIGAAAEDITSASGGPSTTSGGAGGSKSTSLGASSTGSRTSSASVTGSNASGSASLTGSGSSGSPTGAAPRALSGSVTTGVLVALGIVALAL